MKKKYLVLSVVLTILFVQCQKSDDNDEVEETPCVEVEMHNYPDSRVHVGVPSSLDNGISKAMKLDKSWTGSCSVREENDSLLSIILSTSRTSGSTLSENLYFGYFVEETGCRLLSTDNCGYLLRSLDQSAGEWKLYQEDGLGNNLEIDTIIGDSIWGRFSLSFKDTSDNPGTFFQPELIRFYNGEFEAKIIR